MKFSNKQSLYEEINIKKSNNKIDEKELFFYPKEIKEEYSFMKRYDWECHPVLIPML